MNLIPSFKVERTREDGLLKEVWDFANWDNQVFLDVYLEQTREATTQKFKEVRVWARQRHRLQQYMAPSIQETEVPLPEDVVDEARKTYLRLVQETLKIGFQSTDTVRAPGLNAALAARSAPYAKRSISLAPQVSRNIGVRPPSKRIIKPR